MSRECTCSDQLEACDCGYSTDKPCFRNDPVSPKHYQSDKFQLIDVIDSFGLDFYQGTILQYIVRHKGKNGVEDLKKARWYLDRYIEKQ